MKTMLTKTKILSLVICILLLLTACELQTVSKAYHIVNGNIPQFEPSDITTDSYELYSELDAIGRCGVAMACIGVDIMPTEERGAIGQVKPSGWQMAKYDIVDGNYLYNRCHLIGYQLTGENANEKNLITGTRYMNTQGMLPFENMVASYVEETKNHVMYRVTPQFDGENLVATGVQMEALSVEDGGSGIAFNVFVNNIQPGIEIDYATGQSRLINSGAQHAFDASSDATQKEEQHAYILNTNTKKFHEEACASIDDIQAKNKETYNGTRAWLTQNGYSPCGRCKP
ncbi:MAG: hypothetical protein E7402_04040 [Ruminococcaceae bacterium]|nr:hypothetical protein [Oscillospiraceae bacterium]